MRKIIPINEGWRFIREDAGLPGVLPQGWQRVDLPHTWNAVDGHDGNGDYYRGSCWYAREFDTPCQPLPGGRVYVEIPAAGQQAVVYVNGKKAAEHLGGYSLFRADVTELCREEGPNLLVINCSNQRREDVYPQAADFTFYGGLYRGVNLISVADTRFDLDYMGGLGFDVIASPCQKCGGARFQLKSFITNPGPDFTVQYGVYDKEGRLVAGGSRPSEDPDITLRTPKAHLWSPDSPYLYTVTAEILRRNEVVDSLTVKAGVRSFSVDPEKGFILNGQPLPLRGVSRHQDRLYQGNALSREDHFADAEIIKELGANTVRLAHYQHSQDFYDACDELGFVVWAEIPFISVFNKDPAAHENCKTQLTELIVQNFNHPSICFWGISNEILIGGICPELVENHRELNQLARRLDPSRLTTIAHVSMTPEDSPLHDITNVESYNHYFGWYGGKMEDNGPWLDAYHKNHPDRCLGVSEYGCEGIVTYHGPSPACRDYSEEYQALYHEHMAKVVAERPWLWSTHVWNMFDFGCAARNEGGVAGRNNKGLVTIDRKTRKDSFYIYQAYWSKRPMVHICGRRYAQRAGETTEVKVYSNQPRVSLSLNGSLAEEKTGDKVFVFTVSLAEGHNTLTASAGDVWDSVTLERVEKEPEIYALPQDNSHAEGVANWFKLTGDLDLTAPMEFPEGKFSVKNTLEEVSRSPQAWEVVSTAMEMVSGMPLKPGEGMWGMLKAMSLEQMIQMGGSRMPKGFAESLNAQLVKIDRA
jgi:beta-galactosidase